MNRFRSLSILSLLILASGFANAAMAQERANLEREIESLKQQIADKEKEFLSPSAEDKAAFASFLSQPDSGLIRLMPREKYRTKLLIREGGAFYSFTKLVHEFGDGSDIMLEQKFFTVGVSGADFGSLINLGDIPIETVNLTHPAIQFLADYIAPTLEPQAREQYRNFGAGIQQGDFSYKSRLEAKVNTTYALRSINYDTSDVLVAFRVVRQDTDGSLILAWKMLKQFPTPKLERP